MLGASGADVTAEANRVLCPLKPKKLANRADLPMKKGSRYTWVFKPTGETVTKIPRKLSGKGTAIDVINRILKAGTELGTIYE